MTPGTRRMTAVLFAAGLSVAPLGAVSAQAPATDARWDAWIGCWTPAGAPDGQGTAMLCVVPSAGSSAVDFVTVRGGKEVSREHVDASGRVVNNVREGCTGWQRGDWAKDDERVYLHTDYTCPSGQRQTSSTILGMTVEGELLDVQGLKAGRNQGVRVTRYRVATDAAGVPADLAGAIGQQAMATAAARVAASAPIATDDVIEASSHADAPVVEAFLANRGDEFAVSAKDLERMANEGVPGDVTDVVVALSNPRHFALNPALGGEGNGLSSGAPGVVATNADSTRRAECPYDAYGWNYATPCYYSPWYGYSPYGPWAGAYGYGYGYGPAFGYGGYGYGYGYGGYGWYGSGPVIVVTNPNNNAPSGHGHVVRGRGYVPGQAAPTGSQRAGSAQSAPPPSSSSSGSSGSSSAGSSGGRTAHPRGGGGGL